MASSSAHSAPVIAASDSSMPTTTGYEGLVVVAAPPTTIATRSGCIALATVGRDQPIGERARDTYRVDLTT